MKRILALCITFLTVDVVLAAPTAFFNVNVIPMTGDEVIAAQTVIVEGGVITMIGDVDTVSLPKGTQVIDGTERYLLPGLAEMHAHVPGTDSEELDRVLTLFAANGVTTIRGMLGQPSHLALRQELLDGDRFGPRLITSGPSLNGNSVAGPADGERQVRAQHLAGYDFLKIHPGLTASEYRAIAATANELGMPFAGHVPVAVGLEKALESGIASIDHLDGYMAALLPPLGAGVALALALSPSNVMIWDVHHRFAIEGMIGADVGGVLQGAAPWWPPARRARSPRPRAPRASTRSSHLSWFILAAAYFRIEAVWPTS